MRSGYKFDQSDYITNPSSGQAVCGNHITFRVTFDYYGLRKGSAKIRAAIGETPKRIGVDPRGYGFQGGGRQDLH